MSRTNPARFARCGVSFALLLCACSADDDGGSRPDAMEQEGAGHAAPPAGGAGSVSEPPGDESPDAGQVPSADAPDASSACAPGGTRESECGDGVDQDCDGVVDCLDPDCEGESCGDGELSCRAGGCLAPCEGDDCLPDLPPLENVSLRVRGDTLLVDFSAVDGARDYRIYP